MKYKLETGLGAFCEREIENILSENGCQYKKESNKMGAAYEVETRAPFIDACVEAVLDFYKQRELLAVLGEKDEMEHFAILGTLLSVERDTFVRRKGVRKRRNEKVDPKRNGRQSRRIVYL